MSGRKFERVLFYLRAENSQVLLYSGLNLWRRCLLCD
jgi:hypothetical protein